MDYLRYGDYGCVDVDSGIARCALPSSTGEAPIVILSQLQNKKHVLALQTLWFQWYSQILSA